MNNLDDATPPTCTVCGCGLYDTELGRQACTPCERRTDENLLALPGERGLYARLSASLTPGSGSDGPSVSGSRTAPLPLRLEPLSLMARGGVVTVLQTWLIDWHDVLGFTHPRWKGDLQQQCDQVIKALRVNLPWAAAEHPAFAEFAWEVSAVRRQCERQVTGERPERRVTVQCSCGQPLRITLSTPGRQCSGCGAQYGWEELRELPLAERTAA